MEYLKVRRKDSPSMEMSVWIDWDRHEVRYFPLSGGNQKVESEGKFFGEWELVKPLKEENKNK